MSFPVGLPCSASARRSYTHVELFSQCLVEACKKGDIPGLEEIFSFGCFSQAAINEAFVLTAGKKDPGDKDVEIVEKLIQRKEDPKVSDQTFSSVVLLLADMGNLKMMQCLADTPQFSNMSSDDFEAAYTVANRKKYKAITDLMTSKRSSLLGLFKKYLPF